MLQTTDPKTSISDLTGLAPEQIGAQYLQVDVLKQEGVLINLDIAGSSMFVCGADWGELGVSGDSTRAARMTPGRKFLYPKAAVNKINSVVTSMRQALERYSYDLTGFRPSRYMHYKVYGHWRKEWDQLLERFNAVKAELIAMHDQAVDELADEFRSIAAEAWAANGHQPLFFKGVKYSDLDEFTDAVVARVLSKMPDVETIEAGMHADYRVSMLYGLEEIARAEANATRIREQAEAELAKAKDEQQAAYLNSAILQEQYNHQERMLRLEEQEKELAIEAMMHAEAEHARAQLKEIVSPYQEVFIALRNQIAQDATEMLASVQKNGFCKGKIAERGRGLLDLYELMTIGEDATLRGRLVELRNAIGTIGDDRPKDAAPRDTAQVVSALESIRELAHSAAQDLAAGPSRFSFLE
jgi:hypothetical protein